MRFPRLTLALLFLLPLLAVSACAPEDQADADEITIPTRTVTTQAVEKGDLVRTVEVIGTLQGIEEVEVFPQVADRVLTLAVREGDEVKSGQVLAVLRSDLTSAGLQQARAGLEAATASAESLADEVARAKQLVEAGTMPRSQLDQLEGQLRSARAQVRQAGAAVASASAQQSRTVVKAPIDGVVAQVNVEEGDMAAPQMPLMTVVKRSALKAVLRVPERDFLKVREGMPAELAPLAETRQRSEAQVTLKGPVVDRMTRTGLVEVRLENPEGRLVPGSAVRVTIELGRRADVVLVPAHAVILTPETERTGGAIAFVVADGIAHRREVVVGDRQGDLMEVREGLEPGERLVILGAQLLKDENPVEEAGAARAARAAEESPDQG